MIFDKTENIKPIRHTNHNHLDDASKHNQPKSMPQIGLIQKTSPSFEEQLNEVFLKRPKNSICGDHRADVLNKGALRFIRKVFRHIYSKMFEPKRRRTQQTKAIQFENILNQFKDVWLDQNALIFREG